MEREPAAAIGMPSRLSKRSGRSMGAMISPVSCSAYGVRPSQRHPKLQEGCSGCLGRADCLGKIPPSKLPEIFQALCDAVHGGHAAPDPWLDKVQHQLD